MEMGNENKIGRRNSAPRFCIVKARSQGLLATTQCFVGRHQTLDFPSIGDHLLSEQIGLVLKRGIQVFGNRIKREPEGAQVTYENEAAEVAIAVIPVAAFLARYWNHQPFALVMLERILTHAHTLHHFTDAIPLVHNRPPPSQPHATTLKRVDLGHCTAQIPLTQRQRRRSLLSPQPRLASCHCGSPRPSDGTSL